MSNSTTSSNGRNGTQYGYALASEEHSPLDLVRFGQLAEDAGFDFAMISDHYHPWTSHQGNSPFVWSVIGGIAASTDRIAIGTAVTCPTTRIHPAIVAQASATAAAMLPDRFFLGVGTGEALNEHILGDAWPHASVRVEMLEEAISVIRSLWSGEEVSHYGTYFTVDRAQLFTRPTQPPPLFVASSSPSSSRLAAANDGIIMSGPDPDRIGEFEQEGGQSKPRFAQLGLCWDPDASEARQIADSNWPISALSWPLKTDTATTAHFDAIVDSVASNLVSDSIPIASSAGEIVELIDGYAEIGIDHIYLHQIGPKQPEFLRLMKDEVLPQLRRRSA